MPGPPAILRFSRDKRGYEHFYLVEPGGGRRGRDDSRILYWFRSPPGVKVGRPPFDEDMRREIEARNPNISFDWRRLLATPIPPPQADVERWRERRRAEKAEKAARAARRADLEPAASEPEPGIDEPAPEGADGGSMELSAPVDPAPSAPPTGSKKRRRRRRRRGGQSRGQSSTASSTPSGAASDAVTPTATPAGTDPETS